MLLLLLLAAQDVTVLGPGKPNAQTPATLLVEPAAAFIVACDRDRDARTSRAELDACVEGSFGTAPLGFLAYADWQTRWLGDQGALPGPYEIDRDGDDRITPAELRAQFARLHARYDTNADGQVTRAEALTIRAAAVGGDRPARGVPPGAQRVPGGKPDRDPRP